MWARIICTIIGLWVMIAPGIFDFNASAEDNGHIIGPIVVTFSVIAFWDATRGVRKWNYPVALWLLLAPWILGYSMGVATTSDMIAGVLIIIFSSVKGRRKHSFGGGWSSLWKDSPGHLRNK